MGIQGFTSFVDKNQYLLVDYKLYGTKLIIDGNNLYHFLYYYFGINHEYGGDYDVFASKIRYFFDTLNSCHVKPYVVFDGAYEKDNRKLRTTLKRAQERIHLAGFISNGRRGKVLPILACKTFQSMLNVLDVPHVTCDTEADSHIAALANRWHCPVMSNDSDFFFYNLNSGFILFDYINLRIMPGDDGSLYLNVQLYTLDSLLNYFGNFDRSLVPFMATILGNDIVDCKHFDIFFASSQFPKFSKDLSCGQRYTKIYNLLTWFSTLHSSKTAVEIVLSCVSLEKRIVVRELMMKSMELYENPRTDLEESDFELDVKCASQCRENKLKSFDGNELPPWFVNSIRRGHCATFLLNAVMLRRAILMAQVEHTGSDNSYMCALPIRQLVYGVLLTVDKDSASCEEIKIKEYQRNKKELALFLVEPVFLLSSQEEVPRLVDIPNLCAEDWKIFILNSLGISSEVFENWTEDNQLILCCILFWIKSSAEPSFLHVLAILLTLFKLCAIDVLIQNYDSVDADSPTMSFAAFVKVNSSKELLENVDKSLGRIVKSEMKHRDKHFDSYTVHAFSQLQSCAQAMIYLNQVLQKPFLSIEPQLVFNGTFFYKVMHELSSRKCPELYVEEVLGRSFLAEYYKRCLESIMNCSSINRDLNRGVTNHGKKPMKVSKSAVNAAAISGPCKISSELLESSEKVELSDDSDSEMLEDVSRTTTQVTLPKYLKSNKFHLLAIIDSD